MRPDVLVDSRVEGRKHFGLSDDIFYGSLLPVVLVELELLIMP